MGPRRLGLHLYPCMCHAESCRGLHSASTPCFDCKSGPLGYYVGMAPECCLFTDLRHVTLRHGSKSTTSTSCQLILPLLFLLTSKSISGSQRLAIGSIDFEKIYGPRSCEVVHRTFNPKFWKTDPSLKHFSTSARRMLG